MTEWEDISIEKASQPRAAQLPLRDPPSYSHHAGPPRLRIIGATWGGVQVTEDIQDMVSATETVIFDMRTLHQLLQPDPAYGTVKTLSVLYTYEGLGDVYLLNMTEQERSPVSITPTARHSPESSQHLHPSIRTLEVPFWKAGRDNNRHEDNAGHSEVEILAVLYGPQMIDTPKVLKELSRFFEGRRGQIRMTNSFFKVDTWPGERKSWVVYFRFVGSPRIQVVTGMEDGALEVPWSRH
ncbi:hypothetical protein VP1G_04259 [Cytospora mali]|uniref:Uncharacterized protein n=1 Tax=Cytospora mali TaxID=578113 RepID=A0A194UZB6_CYTMA|nr:hypothetical protein VP1G_04259 [Valsa mali var. pyri (nom. inval.)]